MSFNFFAGVVQGENNKKKYFSKSGTQGNGKTLSVVRYCVNGWRSGAWVFTNFKTKIPGDGRPFSFCMSLYDMINYIEARQKYIMANNVQVVIGLMELWSIVQFFDDPKKQSLYAKFTNQLRKMNIDLYGDSQRNMHLPPGLRDNVNNTYLPCKIHDDGEICVEPKCKVHHTIEVVKVDFQQRGAPLFNVVDRFDAGIYGKFYNSFSNELIDEPDFD